jgi:hypothetical protein
MIRAKEVTRVLDPSRKAIDIAMRLHAELGREAFSFVSVQVEEARQSCDQRGVQHWNDVASELLTLGECADRGVAASMWGAMQQIEYYRHRATVAERKAATAPEAYRHDMLELARQWRDLALHADLQARLIGKAASRGDA